MASDLDLDTIVGCFIEVAQRNVGGSLALVGPTGEKEPAVIVSRPDAPKPSYPYITLDVLSITETSGNKLREGLDEHDNYFLENHYKITLRYIVFGGNAIQIASELEQSFDLPNVIRNVSLNTGGEIEDTSEVVSLPKALSTEMVDVARFDVTYNVCVRNTDTSASNGYFNTINIEGEALTSENDNNPLKFNVSETSN